MSRRLGAEFLGTAWLVFGGCGSAVLAAAFPELGIGFLGVSLAFGLTVLTMAYAVGHISGGHFNPAVTVGLWAGGRFPSGEILPYLAAQVAGAIAGAFLLSLIATGKAGSTSPERVRRQRVRRALAGRLLARRRVRGRGRPHLHLPDRDPGRDRPARARGLRADRDRPRAHAHPPGRHPGHEHVRQPGAQHGAGALRRGLGARAAVALLGGADRRCGARRGRRTSGSPPTTAADRARPRGRPCRPTSSGRAAPAGTARAGP